MTTQLIPINRQNRTRKASAFPVPMAGETQIQFFQRASRALRKRIPSVNRRTLRVLNLWADSPNARALSAKAAEQFPADKFVHAGPRCVFVEHTVPASRDGLRGEIKYGRSELQHLVNWANYRIRNAGNFAAISDGHTPSQEEKVNGVPDPDVLGYAGPFYLGLLGDVDPRWAIYADEWVHSQDVPRFMKLQRRSPEVWANEPIQSRTMDPIAALGAATPCLDSGMNPYCRSSDGRLVMRYSAMTFPGPFNSSTPFAGPVRPPFSGDPSMPFPNDDNARLALTNAVSEALQAVLPSIMQSVFDRMCAGDGETPPPDDDTADETMTGLDEDVPGQGALPDDDDPDAHKYSALTFDDDFADRNGPGPSPQHGLSSIISRQARVIQKLRSDLAQERRDISRYSRLQDLSRQFAFDPHEEFEACREFNDAQFARHCDRTVAKYARRDELGYVDLPDDLEPDRYSGARTGRISPAQVERFSREAASLAARKNAAKSSSTTFEAEFDAICRQHGVSV